MERVQKNPAIVYSTQSLESMCSKILSTLVIWGEGGKDFAKRCCTVIFPLCSYVYPINRPGLIFLPPLSPIFFFPNPCQLSEMSGVAVPFLSGVKKLGALYVAQKNGSPIIIKNLMFPGPVSTSACAG